MPAASSFLVPFRGEREIEAALPSVVAHLASGGVLAYPTETVYGLGCALNADAIARLTTLKSRPLTQPYIVLIADAGMLPLLGVALDDVSRGLVDRYWPGPLTLVLPSHAAFPGVTGPHGEIAVRWTPHAGVRRIIRAFGAPITSTSANRHGLPPLGTAAEILAQWHDAVVAGEVLVLDGGTLPPSSPSTVVDCAGPHPRVIREGKIGLEELRRIVPGLR